MNQGTFLSSYSEFELQSEAAQTGEHKVWGQFPGGAIIQETFDATSGQRFTIPNIFNEDGSFNLWVVQPDGTMFEDGSDCPMSVKVMLDGCGRVSVSGGGTGGGMTHYYQKFVIPGGTPSFTVTVNGGVLPSNPARDLQLFQYPGGQKLLINSTFTVSGSDIILDPAAIMPFEMTFELFFQI